MDVILIAAAPAELALDVGRPGDADDEMNPPRLRPRFPVIWLSFVFLAGCAANALAATSKPAPVPLGGNTYRLTREAGTVFARATAPLKYEAQGDAAEFCAAQGKRMKLVSVDEEKGSIVRGGFSRVTIVFKVLEPGDPELAGEPNAGEPIIARAPEDEAQRHLRMLDELHAGGILTDAEFDAASQRVRARTK